MPFDYCGVAGDDIKAGQFVREGEPGVLYPDHDPPAQPHAIARCDFSKGDIVTVTSADRFVRDAHDGTFCHPGGASSG